MHRLFEPVRSAGAGTAPQDHFTQITGAIAAAAIAKIAIVHAMTNARRGHGGTTSSDMRPSK